MNRKVIRFATPVAKYLFIAIVPMLPLLGYVASATPSLSILWENLETPSHLRPQPRIITGSPVAPSEQENGRRRGPSPFT